MILARARHLGNIGNYVEIISGILINASQFERSDKENYAYQNKGYRRSF